MAKTTTKKAKAPATPTRKRAAKSTTARQKPAVDRAADLSDEVLKSVESGQRAAIEAVRKFVDTVDEALPTIGDRPSRRETVIDGALEMAEKLVSTQYNFLRSVVQSADRSLSKQSAAKK
jgi:N-acetylglucosamine kinase-like BadF-type ATPase